MSFAFKLNSKRGLLTSAIATTAISSYYWNKSSSSSNNHQNVLNEMNLPPLIESRPPPPSREDLLKKLETTPNFDVLIIGGGATGSGCAVDASTRGLNVALVEKNDFASGTSSKSTKMAHGGVRYLEKAFWQLSKTQLDLVIEALDERNNMIKTAPHLVSILPILIPVYNYWKIPYFYIGTKMYDIFAGHQNLRNSFLMGSSKTLAVAPQLDPKDLKAGLVYHDGSFNDSRMNSTLAITAIENGATVLNYVEVLQLLKNENDGKIIGALARDRETGKEYKINAKTVVNSTGPYADMLLEMDKDPNGILPKNLPKPKMVVPSAGVHVVLPEFYCPKELGILDARTSDGRVMFFLPWQGKVLAGTTDVPLDKIPEHPTPTEADIQDILQELQHYIKFPVRREDVLSAWSGIRPLVKDPRKSNDLNSTQNLVRSHLLFTSSSGLITISGGKWTTYRRMAEETIDEVVKQGNFKVGNCITKNLILAGGENYEATLGPRLAQKYEVSSQLALHLAHNYGTRAPIILESFKSNKFNQLPIALASLNERPTYEQFEHPFSIAELKYCIKYEYVRTPVDFLARRSRMVFLDSKAAINAIDGVVKVLGDELGWNDLKRIEETKLAQDFIKSFN